MSILSDKDVQFFIDAGESEFAPTLWKQVQSMAIELLELRLSNELLCQSIASAEPQFSAKAGKQILRRLAAAERVVGEVESVSKSWFAKEHPEWFREILQLLDAYAKAVKGE